MRKAALLTAVKTANWAQEAIIRLVNFPHCSGENASLLVPWMPTVARIIGGPPPQAVIVGFGHTTHVFNSKQKPRKVTIFGDDFRYGHERTSLLLKGA